MLPQVRKWPGLHRQQVGHPVNGTTFCSHMSTAAHTEPSELGGFDIVPAHYRFWLLVKGFGSVPLLPQGRTGHTTNDIKEGLCDSVGCEQKFLSVGRSLNPQQ